MACPGLLEVPNVYWTIADVVTHHNEQLRSIPIPWRALRMQPWVVSGPRSTRPQAPDPDLPAGFPALSACVSLSARSGLLSAGPAAPLFRQISRPFRCSSSACGRICTLVLGPRLVPTRPQPRLPDLQSPLPYTWSSETQSISESTRPDHKWPRCSGTVSRLGSLISDPRHPDPGPSHHARL